MDLVRINDVVDNFGLSSRTLRYYEERGLLWSHHPDNKAQRYYDADALERLKQIIVLRKMQIPIKDMVTVFKTESTATLIQVFVDKLDALNVEITALSELKQLVDDFFQSMLQIGIKKISTITLLYEETEKRLATVEINEPASFEKLSEVSRRALKLNDVRIIRLPAMRMLTSRFKTGEIEVLDVDKMQNLFAKYNLMPIPGMRNCFFRKEKGDEWVMMMNIPDHFENQTPYIDEHFLGGLYAVTSAFVEDMDTAFILLKDWVNKSEDYMFDSGENDALQRIEMIEEILPWDIATKSNRYQQDVFIPIKIRTN